MIVEAKDGPYSGIMPWYAYWFMFPVCIVVAGAATFSGISGAALLTPFFLIGFPLLGVPPLSTIAAIGTSLFLETSGFGMGVYHYWRMRLADLSTARSLAVITLPLGLVGAILAHRAPAQLLRIGYGVAMLVVAWVLRRESPGEPANRPCPCLVCHSECSRLDCAEEQQRRLIAADSTVYRYCVYKLPSQKFISGAGALVAGLISTGVGEATLPSLVQRVRLPVPVAAATSTLVVGATVVGAAAAHIVLLMRAGGLHAVPWALIAWSIPGALIGATLGTRLQGKVSEHATKLFFSALFFIIGITFLLAFTIFAQRFSK